MISRETATTYFILASDIELYPSPNLIPKFLHMVSTYGLLEDTVYVLPIFEIEREHENRILKKNVLCQVFLKFLRWDRASGN